MVVVALAWLTLPFAFRARLIFDISHFHALLLPFFRSRSTFVALASSTSVTFSGIPNSFFLPSPPFFFSAWNRAREPIAPQIRGSTVTAIIGHSSSSCVYIYNIFSIYLYIFIFIYLSHIIIISSRVLLRFFFYLFYLFREVRGVFCDPPAWGTNESGTSSQKREMKLHGS